MGKARKRPAPRFTEVHCRLFTEDVDELKRQAEAAGDFNWQPRLRKLVHNALRTKGVVK